MCVCVWGGGGGGHSPKSVVVYLYMYCSSAYYPEGTCLEVSSLRAVFTHTATDFLMDHT